MQSMDTIGRALSCNGIATNLSGRQYGHKIYRCIIQRILIVTGAITAGVIWVRILGNTMKFIDRVSASQDDAIRSRARVKRQ